MPPIFLLIAAITTSTVLDRVQLDRDYVGKTAGKNLLVPGMTLTADILTDRTTLLMYLLGPIRQGFGNAMPEQG